LKNKAFDWKWIKVFGGVFTFCVMLFEAFLKEVTMDTLGRMQFKY